MDSYSSSSDDDLFELPPYIHRDRRDAQEGEVSVCMIMDPITIHMVQITYYDYCNNQKANTVSL